MVMGLVHSVILATIYVGSLYIWKDTGSRDSVEVIKHRFISATISSFLSLIYTYYFTSLRFYAVIFLI